MLLYFYGAKFYVGLLIDGKLALNHTLNWR